MVLSHVFNPSQTVSKLKTLVLGTWILFLLKSINYISADVALLKSMELNQEKNGLNRSLSMHLGAEYPSSSEPITVAFVCQFNPISLICLFHICI